MRRQGVCHRRVSRQCEKGQTIYTREKRVRTTHRLCRESKTKRKTKRAKQPETSQELYYQNKKDKDKETWEYFEKDMRKYIN